MNKRFFNKSIYPKEYICSVLSDYEKYAKTELEEDDNYWIIIFSETLYDMDLTIKEFENYLIDLMMS